MSGKLRRWRDDVIRGKCFDWVWRHGGFYYVRKKRFVVTLDSVNRINSGDNLGACFSVGKIKGEVKGVRWKNDNRRKENLRTVYTF